MGRDLIDTLVFTRTPISFFWILYFQDGTAIAQYDPETGKERLYRDALKYHSAVCKAGWYPLTDRLAKLLRAQRLAILRLPYDRKMEMDIGSDCELILMKRNMIAFGTDRGRNRGPRTIYLIGRVCGGTLDIQARDHRGVSLDPPRDAIPLITQREVHGD